MKRFIVRNIMLSLPVFAIGCATQSVQTVKTATLEPKAEAVETKSFTQTLIPVTLAQSRINPRNCPRNESWKNEEWKTLFAQANSCAHAGQWQTVEKMGDHMTKSQIGGAWGPYYLSLAAESRQDSTRALWMIELALKKSSKIGMLYYQKGRLLWTQGSFDEALVQMNKALQLDPNIMAAHQFMGQVYFRDQDYARAANHFQAILHVEPTNVIALVGLSEIRFVDRDYKSAVDLLKTASREYPDNINFRIRLAGIFENYEKDYEAALAAYRSVRNLLKSAKTKPQLDFNVDEKIASIEKLMAKAPGEKVTYRQPGNANGNVKNGEVK